MFLIDFYTKQKQEFKGKLNIYLCGPTVYDYPHIGNFRAVVVFDVLHRLAKVNKQEVIYVHNITDIDDKIIDQALKQNKTEKLISEKYLINYLLLLKKLNIIKPTYLPKVSDNITGMINFIKKLLDLNYAYQTNEGVYFSINKWENYNSKLNIDMGELINKQSKIISKNNQNDFALWKTTTAGIKFDSPWGKGRPGWHTECSYLIEKYFGNNGIDIHGGGIDLYFPHHINEMAQYEAIHKNQLAKSWLYVGHINFNNKKMSKSLNNIIYAKDFLKAYSPNTLRMLFLLSYYQKPININENVINNAKIQIAKISNFLIKINKIFNNKSAKSLIDQDFIKILENNLNTPNAISYLMLQLKKINKKFDEIEYQKLIFNLEILGFNLKYLMKK
ncbi:MAG: cysteine--tRNA ligase [Candidatus Hepatoplasma scabrum]|nr:MAG: cysteine--tRNA ligase [Candidatus Hepatoplasma sp.]